MGSNPITYSKRKDNMKFKAEYLDDMFFNGDSTLLKEQWNSEWIQNYKHQYKEIVFEFDGKFYKWFLFRSGSPFLGWFYSHEDCLKDWIECPETKRQTKIVEYWT